MEGWLPASYFLERGVKCDFDLGGDDGDDGAESQKAKTFRIARFLSQKLSG